MNWDAIEITNEQTRPNQYLAEGPHMAIKPTIYKFSIALSDLDRDRYEALELTVAQHPSETVERMMVRVLAFCLNTDERLSFAKGLSEATEPDIWAHTLDGQISLWIDVGEPSADRMKKATRLAQAVHVYSFNSKSNSWWNLVRGQCAGLGVSVVQFEFEAIQALAKMIQRTMSFSVTISDSSAYLAFETGECEIAWIALT